MQLICAISLTTIVGQSVISPALPTIRHALGVAPEQIGLVITAFTLPGIFFVPITGVLADRYGRRTIIIPLLFLYGITGAASGLAPDFETLLALRFLTGIAAGSLGSLSIVLVADFFSDKQRARVFGMRMAIGQVGNATMPLVAGGLAVIGWQYPFALYALAIPVGLFALKIMEKDRPEESAGLTAYLSKTLGAVSSKRILTLLTIPLSLTIVNHGINLTFIPILMELSFDASAFMIGIIVSARVTVGAIFAFNLGRLVARFGEVNLLYVSFSVLGIAFLITPLMPSVWWLLAPAILSGITTGMAFPAFQSILVRQAPEGSLAGVMAANSVAARLGQTIGPLLAGLGFTVIGLDLVFVAAAVIVFAALIFLAFALRRYRTAPAP
ncbi:MAG: MFS transporter [Rhodospirillaceae bacterium]|nr:MFS transporter [Rhodospirillaceae bacterium]MBT3887580.1 MFS transporter [Rhodospirillaceae bacterium]MBT4117981.1 MFS transporter [Rhodospirillaceae bacterium]MBT4673976.1 MFS transporter [Rhodospirillaceae bacterium]MBT4721996.1 MFS transporter [Rhodospirillaceae bacterium]